ncbi:hypothetical protein [Nocardiopsis sp. NRRL B-16309]|uniref:hypothetical protein n=1 Tax=Nocardiopsis sp. NRRL B-16309 TaxID=1519494 RepID=UPI0006AF8AAB|nr:hypothetical protein [Nocardiopsis sp. NRRL B-16309]
MSLIKTLTRRATVTATAALMLPALVAVPAANAAAPSGTSVEEVEILVTDDHEIVELGDEGEYEDVDDYLEENSDEAGGPGDESGVSTLGTGLGYISSGTLKIVTSNCTSARVSYTKRSGATITVRFRVHGSSGWSSRPSSWRSVSNGGYTSAYFSNTKNARLRGEMQVSGQGEFITTYAPCR